MRKFFIWAGISVFALLIILGCICAYPSSNQQAIADFMQNSSVEKPALLIALYNHGLVKNIVAVNAVAVADNGYGLLLKGMGLDSDAQALATPYVRYVKVVEGLRKEQIADNVGKVLAWSTTQKSSFEKSVQNLKGIKNDGFYYPETYLVPVNVSGTQLGSIMAGKFSQEINSDKNIKIANSTSNLEKDIIIASLIQREAGGKSDMNLISGIIWNRLNKGMALQIDSTLQYAKGNSTNGWWPQVTPADKSIQSPYNTYLNKGLPPTPISNPGLAAIEAAVNPQKTSCLYYFHDKNRQIHCSDTYAEHVQKIKEYL